MIEYLKQQYDMPQKLLKQKPKVLQLQYIF